MDADARSLTRQAIGRFGRIDALVHVAGGFAGGNPIHETDDATWDAMMNLNLRAAFFILRSVIPHMRKEGRGASWPSAAARHRAGSNIAAYSASKAALVSLVRTAALENRDLGITANVILPGTIDTDANRRSDPHADRSRWVSPERLAELAYFWSRTPPRRLPGRRSRSTARGCKPPAPAWPRPTLAPVPVPAGRRSRVVPPRCAAAPPAG